MGCHKHRQWDSWPTVRTHSAQLALFFMQYAAGWSKGAAGVPRTRPGLRTYLPGGEDLLNVIQVDAVSVFQPPFSTPRPQKTGRY